MLSHGSVDFNPFFVSGLQTSLQMMMKWHMLRCMRTQVMNVTHPFLRTVDGLCAPGLVSNTLLENWVFSSVGVVLF